MNYVSKSKIFLGVVLTSAALSGCSLTEFVTGKPESTTTAQTNSDNSSFVEADSQQNEPEQVFVAQETQELPKQTSPTQAQAEPRTNFSESKPEPKPEPKPTLSQVAKVNAPAIKRLPAEKPATAMTYYGSVKQPYRPIARQRSSNEQFMPPISQHSLSSAEHSVMVEEYIERVSTDLINSLANNLNAPVIGVTSFVDFNNNLTSVTPFGNRIAEHFISELQQSGFMVADYKVKDMITVNHNGDIVFSRNTNELNAVEGMTHVLAGTIMYQEKGLKIIARVVDFDNKWVVATASTFMPYFVLDTIVPSEAKQTVY